MAGGEFDPHKFIDRDFEQSLFEELLAFQDEARLLTIQDGGGMGKTQLLLRFQHRCRTTRPRIPAGLIALDQLLFPRPLTLVQRLEQELSTFSSLTFPTFARYEAARKAHDFTTIRGRVDLQGANLSGAQVKAAGILVEQAEQVTMAGTTSPLTPEQQVEAEKVSVRTFLEDLITHANQRPVILLFDAYEKCDPELQLWLQDQFLDPFCFNAEQRPSQLLLVIAGRELPPFENYWPAEECEATIKSVQNLSRWGREHVEPCLQAHGLKSTPETLDLFHKMIERGLSPSLVVEAIHFLRQQEQQ